MYGKEGGSVCRRTYDLSGHFPRPESYQESFVVSCSGHSLFHSTSTYFIHVLSCALNFSRPNVATFRVKLS